MATSGQRIGEYVLDEPLGRGAFGEVWRARHHVWLDQTVAVKIPTDPQYLRNLQREGATIQGLVHPNVARAIAFDPFADPAYLAMEYVPGSSLRPIIAVKSLKAADAIAVMRQVLAGLKYAHEKGVVHRDVKPENILVHERAARDGYVAEGVVKVTDFGLGRTMADGAVASIAYSASMNGPKARELAGTLDYMAPEVRTGGADADARADLYACGVVLYEMLTGERPAGTDVPSDVNPHVPRHLDDVFRRAYARLEKRFTTADEFIAALDPSAAALPAPVLTTPSCPHCRKHVSFGDQFCMHCGIQLVAEVRRCRECGGYPDAADQYCIFCGDALASQTGAPTARAARTAG